LAPALILVLALLKPLEQTPAGRQQIIVCVFNGHMSTVYSVAFSNDGETLATEGYDMTVRFFNVATGRESGMLACDDYVDRVWLSKDNNRLITMERFQPRVWDLAAHPARGLTGGSERQKPALRTLRKAPLEAVAVR
jgi:WD40 repeat protein